MFSISNWILYRRCNCVGQLVVDNVRFMSDQVGFLFGGYEMCCTHWNRVTSSTIGGHLIIVECTDKRAPAYISIGSVRYEKEHQPMPYRSADSTDRVMVNNSVRS